MSNPFKVDPHSKAIVYQNKKERDKLNMDKRFKNHLHKEVAFLADCANWSVDDYNNKINDLKNEINRLKNLISKNK